MKGLCRLRYGAEAQVPRAGGRLQPAGGWRLNKHCSSVQFQNGNRRVTRVTTLNYGVQ